MGTQDFSFYDVIRRNADTFGDRTAWYEVETGQTLSFRQIRKEVDLLAGRLRGARVKKGDRIAVMGKNSLEYFLLYGASAALGAIVLPVNWRLSADEACFNIADGAPVLLFADETFQPMIDANKTKLPSVRTFCNLIAGKGGFEEIAAFTGDEGGKGASDVSAADGFVIIHTAAVDGRPRGALLSHGNLICANLQWSYLLGLTEANVHLNCLPMFHVGGLFMAASSFHAGAVNVNMRKFDAETAAALIEEKKVSHFFDFSPILSAILEQQEIGGHDLSSLQMVPGLDTPETIEKYQRLTGGTFYSLYGQTETSSILTCGPYSERPGSAGRVVPMADIKIVDETDQPVPRGDVGEITMKGPMAFKGYWNLPEETAHTFRNGWHHTGDMGRLDEDGFLFFAGRKPEKELIKPGGENVYPAEVETVIREHPAIDNVVVIGVPDPKWKEGIKAVCRLKKGAQLTPEELIAFVGARIASYKKPQYVEFVEAIPVSADGKPDRARVKALYGGEQ